MAVSKRLRYEVLRRDGHTCRYCGRSAPEVRLTVDHVVPVALGGSDAPDNLVASCGDCNSGKSATPPDANQVAEVRADALRWAEAIRATAQEMVADSEQRGALRQRFFRAWQTWKVGDRPVDLPGNWRESVDSFLAAGLPLAVLIDCIDLAMGRRKVPSEDKFRYMCGIAWKRVAELQEAALQRVARPRPAEAMRQGNGDEVVSDLFGAMPWCDGPDTWPPFLAEFEQAHEDDELEDGSPRTFDHWSDFEKVFAQMVQRLADSYFELTNRIRQILDGLSPEAAERYRNESSQQHAQADMHDASAEAVDAYAAFLAMQDHPDAGGGR